MNRIKEYRVKLELTQTELARVCNVKQNTVSSWETGRSEPDFESLKKMSGIFGCSIDELLGNKETPVISEDGLSKKLAALDDKNLRRMEEYVDLLLALQKKDDKH